MALTFKEKQLKAAARFLRFGNVPVRVKGNVLVVKGKTKAETDRAFKLAKSDLIVNKFKIKVRRSK